MRQIYLLKWLYRRIRYSGFYLLLILSLSLVLMFTNIVGPRVISSFVDTLSNLSERSLLIKYAYLYILIQLFQGVTEWILAFAELKVGQRIVRQTTSDLMYSVLIDPDALYNSQDPGDLFEVLTSDAENIKTFFSETLTNIVIYLVVSVSCLVMIFKTDFVIGFVTASALLLVGIIQSFFPKMLVWVSKLQLNSFHRILSTRDP